MSSTVAIIGNGFDLSLGMPTSYKHFLGSPYFPEPPGEDSLAAVLRRRSQIERWVDIEQELASFSALNSSRTTLKEEYLKLKSRLCEYMASVTLPNDVESTHAKKLVDRIAGSAGLYVVNFNYTSSVKELLLRAGVDEPSIAQLHWSIHGSSEEANIIFGVDDSASVPDEHVYLFKSSAANFSGRGLNDRLTTADEVHFFGHSLGQPDHMYFRLFFGHLASTHTRTRVFFYHYGEQGLHDLILQLRRLTKNRVAAVRSNADVTMIDVSN